MTLTTGLYACVFACVCVCVCLCVCLCVGVRVCVFAYPRAMAAVADHVKKSCGQHKERTVG